MNTRKGDLEKLEEERDRGNKYAGKTLERVYEQSQDRMLEDARLELIKAHRQGDMKRVEYIEGALRKLRTKYSR